MKRRNHSQVGTTGSVVGLTLPAAGSAAILLVASGCSPATAAQREAQAKFAQAEYCPVGRVTAVDLVPVPEAPGPIEHDPERLAMWQAAAVRKASDSTDHLVAVTGCGERVEYSCWEFWERSPPQPGDERLTDAAECREIKRVRLSESRE